MNPKRLVSILAACTALAGTGCAEEHYTVEIDGINVKEGLTDEDGLEEFVDDQLGMDFEVGVKGIDECMPADGSFLNVEGAGVLFFDGGGFSGFLVEHPSNASQLLANNYSEYHEFVLIPLPFFEYTHDTAGVTRSRYSARNYVDWLKPNSDDQGCFAKEDLIDKLRPGTVMIEEDPIYSIGFSEDMIGFEQMYFENKDWNAVRLYTFTPSDYGFGINSTINTLEIHDSMEECEKKE